MDFRFIAFNMMLCTSWGKEEIEEMLQDKLDEKTNGIVKIEYNQIEENKIRLVFWRDSLGATDKDLIIDTDCYIVSGVPVSAFRLGEEEKPLIYPLMKIGKYHYYTHRSAFIRFYRTLLELLGEQKTEEIKIRIYSDRIVLEITY